jgi:hypothetical protein
LGFETLVWLEVESAKKGAMRSIADMVRRFDKARLSPATKCGFNFCDPHKIVAAEKDSRVGPIFYPGACITCNGILRQSGMFSKADLWWV